MNNHYLCSSFPFDLVERKYLPNLKCFHFKMGFWNAVLFIAQNFCLFRYIPFPIWYVFGVVKADSSDVIDPILIKPKQVLYILKCFNQFGQIRGYCNYFTLAHMYSNRFVDRIALHFYFGRLKVSKHKTLFKIWPKLVYSLAFDLSGNHPI